MEYKKTAKNLATKPKNTNLTCASNLQPLNRFKDKNRKVLLCVRKINRIFW